MSENAVQNAPLTGKTVAFLATDGVEQVELTSPWEAVIAAGATPVLVSPKSGTITAMKSWAKPRRSHAPTSGIDHWRSRVKRIAKASR